MKQFISKILIPIMLFTYIVSASAAFTAIGLSDSPISASGVELDTNNSNDVAKVETDNEEKAETNTEATVDTKYSCNQVRGVWVATISNVDFPRKQGESVTKLKAEMNAIVKKCTKYGLNTIFFQVRPSSDAFYKSSIFPWSEYLTGKQGKAPAGGFDPLEYLIDIASKRNIGIQAWVNPFRVSTSQHNLSCLSKSNPARKQKNYVVNSSDGQMYFNPGLPAVRKLIVAGVKEIVENYKVEGIHFDDRFFPANHAFHDKAAYRKYGKGYKSRGAWRRASVNKLIESVHTTVKAIDQDVEFGVSPSGIWANKDHNPLGSATRGMQSFYDNYADGRKWVRKGWIDYIIPQIYWAIGYKIADYRIVLKWWSKTISEARKETDSKTKLYVGMGIYRLSKNNSDKNWRTAKTIKKQLLLNRKIKNLEGGVFFNYSTFHSNKLGVSNTIKKYMFQEK